MKHPKPCPVCGSRHEYFNIEITGRTLHRNADSNKHLLTKIAHGPYWAFAENILTAHAADIDSIEIYDRATGTTYTSTLHQWLDVGFVRDLGFGQQIILPVVEMKSDKPKTPPAGPAAQTAPDNVQPILFESKEITGTVYTPAKSKRPRTRKPARRTWGQL